MGERDAVAENLSNLAPKIVSNPKVAVVDVPMPDRATRKAVARIADGRLTDEDADRYAEVTAGLKAVQIASILAPPPASEAEAAQREAFIAGILGPGPDVPARAKALAALTAGMAPDDIRRLIAPGASAANTDPAAVADRARADVDRLIARRKREILERESFGLVEFVEPAHGFDVVGDMEEVKKDLLGGEESAEQGKDGAVADKLGVTVKPVTPAIVERFGLESTTKGVVITSVAPDSPAEYAGLRNGDIIQKVNRNNVTNVDEYRNPMKTIKDGLVMLKVLRGKSTIYVTIRIGG